MKNIKRINEIIYNTYNKHNNNYFNSININEILVNNNIYNINDNEYENIIKIKNSKKRLNNISNEEEISLKFLKELKCSECHNSVSYKKKFSVICDDCIAKRLNPEKEQLEKLKEEEEIIKNKIEKINLENNILSNNPIYYDKKFVDYYDIILKINSIRGVLNGWKIEFSEKGKDFYEKMKVRGFLKIGVVGIGNKGKTFLLQKIADIELSSGASIKTEGLSIRCLDQNIILLDSLGADYPLEEDSNFDFNKYESNHEELKEHLDDLAKDKILTENFLQNIIINESNMLLIVVGNLTYQEQKLINKIKEESNNFNQSLYVIHNLQTFVEKSQVENYIENTLKKSATFRLVEQKEIRIISEIKIAPEQKENDKYYIEESFNENHKNVYHLIMAREKSPAGDYYNNFAIRFLRDQMNNFPQLTSFPILKKIKDYFFNQSKNYLENPLKPDSFEESEYIIKVKNDTELKLRKPMVDEMGISNYIGNSYNPKYCYFIHNNRFYFQIELPGKFDKKQFKYNIFVKDKYYIIDIIACKIIGSKNFFSKKNANGRFHNTREEGYFNLRINVLAEDFLFKEKKIRLVKASNINLEEKDIILEEGVLTFYIELKEMVKEHEDSESEDGY